MKPEYDEAAEVLNKDADVSLQFLQLSKQASVKGAAATALLHRCANVFDVGEKGIESLCSCLWTLWNGSRCKIVALRYEPF